jgi:hypothetical protein
VSGPHLIEVAGFTWTAPVISIDAALHVTASEIADLILRTLQLPASTSLPQALTTDSGSLGTVIFHEQLARWCVSDDGAITPRP